MVITPFSPQSGNCLDSEIRRQGSVERPKEEQGPIHALWSWLHPILGSTRRWPQECWRQDPFYTQQPVLLANRRRGHERTKQPGVRISTVWLLRVRQRCTGEWSWHDSHWFRRSNVESQQPEPLLAGWAGPQRTQSVAVAATQSPVKPRRRFIIQWKQAEHARLDGTGKQ